MIRLVLKYSLLIVTLLLSFGMTAYAQPDEIYTSWRNDDAVGGYDVVSFYSGKPLRGDKRHQIKYKEANWYFANQANLDLFKTNPDAFVPQYGGYCAWAVARGKLAKGSPKYWHVRDGKLYLNFNGRIQRLWDVDIPTFIQMGDENWPDLIGLDQDDSE